MAYVSQNTHFFHCFSVDILAQVFQQLKKDLKVESNRGFFIDYSATQALLPYLTYKTNKSLLGSAVDLMLQMSMESGKYFRAHSIAWESASLEISSENYILLYQWFKLFCSAVFFTN